MSGSRFGGQSKTQIFNLESTRMSDIQYNRATAIFEGIATSEVEAGYILGYLHHVGPGIFADFLVIFDQHDARRSQAQSEAAFLVTQHMVQVRPVQV